MIEDETIRADLNIQWIVVRKLCAASHRQYMVAGAGGATFVNETPPDDYYNLPLVLAFAVLDQALDAHIQQGTFKCSGERPPLGAKMSASRNALPWQDYQLVEHGKCARNALAHEAKIIPKTDCFNFIDGIERELKAWAAV